ncbi:MAG: HXXEE domain-containing protein [Acidobacteria bacterium]|nr:HXXEE domain-containing protein [Acidobacteriota bacterium]
MSNTSQLTSIRGRHWLAWMGLCAALAIHVVDEAITNFLDLYNPAVLRIRETYPWLFGRYPWLLPTFRFEVWLSLLIFAVIALVSASFFVWRGRWAMRPISYVFAGVMLANGLLHIAISVYMGKLISGVYTSPLLLAASLALIAATRAHKLKPL